MNEAWLCSCLVLQLVSYFQLTLPHLSLFFDTNTISIGVYSVSTFLCTKSCCHWTKLWCIWSPLSSHSSIVNRAVAPWSFTIAPESCHLKCVHMSLLTTKWWENHPPSSCAVTCWVQPAYNVVIIIVELIDTLFT